MPPYQKPQLSALERVLFILKIFRALSNGLLAFVTSPFRGTAGAAKVSNHVKIAMLRSLTRHSSVRDIQGIVPSLDEAYPAYAKKKGFPSKDITLADGTKAYWLGDPSAKKVLIWFHGGGYTLPPDPLHVPFCDQLANQQPGLSVLMLAYTLAPHATYPAQLREAVALVSKLMKENNISPENISLGGDSAGGNLALGVISHLLHPHPEIPAVDLKGRKLGGLILIAPWASFSHDWPSVRDNASKDVVGTGPSDYWSSTFLGVAKKDAYNEPLSLPEDSGWWDGLEGVVNEILVTAGADELLCSSCQELTRRFRKVHGRVEELVAKDEWHDMPLIAALGGGGQQGEVVKAFVKSKL